MTRYAKQKSSGQIRKIFTYTACSGVYEYFYIKGNYTDIDGKESVHGPFDINDQRFEIMPEDWAPPK